jgi:hypothetical protein
MARALAGPGPLEAPEWDDDRTVVVAKVSEGLSADTDMVAMETSSERELMEDGVLR